MSFVPGAASRRSIKCLITRGSFEGVPAVEKRLVHPDPMWRWYFERERLILRSFTPPVRAPRLLAETEDTMILEDLGEPFASGRTMRRTAELLPTLLRLEAWQASLPLEPPPQPILQSLRDRLLEDPTGPWVLDGIARAQDLGILEARTALKLLAVLRDHPLCASRGDLLTRNINYKRYDGGQTPIISFSTLEKKRRVLTPILSSPLRSLATALRRCARPDRDAR